MKMVKSLLLGSAAGLVAVTAGQAAELPVKARPVQYVKVCSLYGAGFYYMPGTDMCIKIGGWVRAEATDVANGNLAQSTSGVFANQSNTRLTNDLTIRARGYITADAREETAYGVARGYIDVGISGADNGIGAEGGSPAAAGLAANSNRAYVQWAGFTAGLAQSFYDFYSVPAMNYRGFIPASDTGDAGQWVWGYTAQFGGGFSATLAAEDRRNTQIVGQGITATAVGAGSLAPGNSMGAGYGGWFVPDIVANLRIDQAWGSAQIMGAYHQVDAGYYGSTAATEFAGNGGPGFGNGFAVGAGLKINFPMIAPGDYFQGQVNYTQGALRYLNDGQGFNFTVASGGTQGYAVQADCVYGGIGATGSSCALTSAWGFDAGYEHYWTPQWHQSITGGYLAVSYPGASNNILCTLEGQGAGVGTGAVATAGCNNNFDYWGVGSRLQWDVTKSFYVGVEVLYSQLISATSATGLVPAANGITAPTTCSTGLCTVADQSNWGFTIRMHKDFLP
jgi:hypothetical protein